MLARLDRILLRFASALALLGGGVLLASMTVTLLSTVGKNARRALDATNEAFGSQIDPDLWSWVHSILGEEEFVGLAIGFALFCALPLAQLSGTHVRVDLFKDRLPAWFNRFVDFVSDTAFAILLWLILWFQWTRVVKKVRGDKLGFWDHLLALDFAAAFDRFRAGNTQILNLEKAPLLLISEVLLLVAFLIALSCVARSALVCFRPDLARD